MRLTLTTLALVALSGCGDSLRDQFRPAITDAPFVDDLGVIDVVSHDDLVAALEGDPMSIPNSLVYSQLGQGEEFGVFGGATVQFAGTGGNVCVVADPEAVYWLRALDTQSEDRRYKYDDVFEDDGDVDISVGLTAYYNGSPGVEIGDFNAVYDDASGQEHTLAFNECTQIGLFGDPAHAGRGAVEYCDIDTSLREGVMYTVLLETFALPIDDSILNYGVMVYDGDCESVPGIRGGAVQDGISECSIPNEVAYAEADGEATGGKDWFAELEAAFCQGEAAVNRYCQDNPGVGCQEGELAPGDEDTE